MRRIRQILTHRLTHKLSLEQTARTVRKSKGCVYNICSRFSSSGLKWPLDPAMTDEQLEQALFPPSAKPSPNADSLPDIAYIESQLSQQHVTVALLYEEYRQQHPGGMSQSSFYRNIRSQKKPVLSLHHVHKGGDTLYTDYSGDGLEYVDCKTGECIPVDLLVTALAASSRIYAECSRSQHDHHFTLSHVHAFEYYGGVTASIVPDNLKSAVTKANRYDPTINHLFAEFADHYGTTILPARVRAPRDKGGVESAVLIAQRWIIAALRNRTFFSLEELNCAVLEQVEFINNRPMKDHGGRSRNERFEDCDKPYLKKLPANRFTISEIKHDLKVGLNYHIQFRKHFYSVPYALAKKNVDVHLNGATIEIYHNSDEHRIAELSEQDMQTIANWVMNEIEGVLDPSPNKNEKKEVTVQYCGGKRIGIRNWLVDRQGHSLVSATHRKWKYVHPGSLLEALQRVKLIPEDLGEMLGRIAE